MVGFIGRYFFDFLTGATISYRVVPVVMER